MPSPVDWALQYAALGWRVLALHNIEPDWRCSCHKADCASPGKHPRNARGVLGASANPETIQVWFNAWPQANVGIATGPASGLWVLDLDVKPGKNGIESMKAWEAQNKPIPTTAAVRTGSGGLHLYFKYPQTKVIGNRTNILPGVDCRGEGGYVVAPPSNHASGGVYEWINEDAIADAD